MLQRLDLRAQRRVEGADRRAACGTLNDCAQSYTFKAAITIIVTGFVGAVWLGFRVLLGK